MIVKDEAEQLAECLEGLRGLMGECCIVDTGSTDATLEIARTHDAKIHTFPWRDDFAAARNESLRHCVGDWILIVDADERISPGDIPAFRALAEGPKSVCYRFITRNYTNAEFVAEFHPCSRLDPFARGFAGWCPSSKVRLFPNHAGARFEGQVHELVHRSLEARGIQVRPCDVPIHHYPYSKSPARVFEKQQLYLRLGHQKVQKHPGDPQAHIELGNQYADMRDYALAAASYRDALKLDPSNPETLKDLGGVLHLLSRHAAARQALRLALKLNPSCAEAWRNLGVICVHEEDWTAAAECFEHGVVLEPGWTEGYRYLSVALEGGGRIEEAVAASRKAVERDSDSAQALRLYLYQISSLERHEEAGTFLESLLRTDSHQPELRKAIEELNQRSTVEVHGV